MTTTDDMTSAAYRLADSIRLEVDLFPGTGAVARAWETWRTSLLVAGHSEMAPPAQDMFTDLMETTP